MTAEQPNEDTRAPSPEAQQGLRHAMDLHARGDIDAALAQAAEVIERWPGFAQALSYYGQTLVTRKRRFSDGLAVLDRAVEAGSDDPYILYSAAWCREFAANAIERPKGAHQPVAESPRVLYAKAKDELLRALILEPDDKLRGDVEDILDVIAKATGEPWDEGLYERAAPRPR
ncbi:MAG: hypothetical protein WCI61_00955 [Chloroflexota bacterium]